jgi:hypothetical protein
MKHTLRGLATVNYFAADHAAAKQWYTDFLGICSLLARGSKVLTETAHEHFSSFGASVGAWTLGCLRAPLTSPTLNRPRKTSCNASRSFTSAPTYS